MDENSLRIAVILIVLAVLYRYGGTILNVAIGLAFLYVLYQTAVLIF